MEKYTIYCTAEQTKKAFELGAPLFTVDCVLGCHHNEDRFVIRDEMPYVLVISTAEQMIGWLEEKGIKEFSIYGANDNKWRYDVWIEYGREPICSCSEGYISRKEATLSAIDAALDYLINNKK